ncbi:MAG TPA: DUF167 domain-containing protein [Thermoleophilaceae bacterium]
MAGSQQYLSERDGSALVWVRVRAGASRNELVGERAGALLVRVTAPPVDGKANDALRKLVAKIVGVPPGRVALVSGASGRDKLLRLEGLSAAAAGERLP